jgi:REP element-mobilizing transposase RayT
MYHLVCPAKYRRSVFIKELDEALKNICIEIEKRYEIRFLEIGTEKDHVHFLIQSVPMLSPKRIVQIVKSITAKQIFLKYPEVKKKLWGGQFWSSGYFISTVGKHGNEETIMNYVKNQGRNKEEYKKIYDNKQLCLFGEGFF